MRIGVAGKWFIVGILATIFCASANAQQFDQKLYSEMRWRCIGPFRGGRTVAVSGVPRQPNVFYMAAVNGGVYKSTDAGKTWTHLGLRDAQQITAILVDPRDPNRVFVAAEGHPYGPNAERGVFRSTDGGKTFQKVLYKDENTGAADLAFDPVNPQTIYAVLWAARVAPWEVRSGASIYIAGSGLYKSTDGGDTWKPLTKGLPGASEGLGRIGVAVAPSEANLCFGGSHEGRGSLSLGRCWRDLEAGKRRPPHRRPRTGRDGHRRGAGESGRDLRGEHHHVEIHGRRKNFRGIQRCAGRRRLPAHLDQLRKSADYRAQFGSGHRDQR